MTPQAVTAVFGEALAMAYRRIDPTAPPPVADVIKQALRQGRLTINGFYRLQNSHGLSLSEIAVLILYCFELNEPVPRNNHAPRNRRAIAQRLAISESTARNYISRVRGKLGTRLSRGSSEILSWGCLHGIFSFDDPKGTFTLQAGATDESQGTSELSDAQWEQIRMVLPIPPRRGRHRVDDRKVLSTLIWAARSRGTLRELPPDHPSPSTCARRLAHWHDVGVLPAIFAIAPVAADIERLLTPGRRTEATYDTQTPAGAPQFYRSIPPSDYQTRFERPLRIAIDFTAAVEYGGIGRYTRELVSALARLDQTNQYRLVFFTETREMPVINDLRLPSNFRFRTVRTAHRVLQKLWFLRPINYLPILPLLTRRLVGPADIFWSPNFQLPPLFRSTGLVTIPDLTYLTTPEQTDRRLIRFLQNAVPISMQRAAGVLTNSSASRHMILNYFGLPPDRVDVVYPGVSERFRRRVTLAEQSRIRSWLGFIDPFILMLARDHPRKNHEGALRAYAQMKAESPDLPHKFVVCGSDVLNSPRITSAVDGLPDAVRRDVVIKGHVDESDLPALYSLASAFLFLSFGEGFGLPVAEAMSAGVPVIVSAASPFPEVVGDAGEIVDASDHLAAARSLRLLLADPDLRRRRIEAGKNRAAIFSWDASAKKILGIFRHHATGPLDDRN